MTTHAQHSKQVSDIIEKQKIFLPFVEKILNKHSELLINFKEATFEQDTKEGFDGVLTLNGKKIALRQRGYEYFKKFFDFTIRAKPKFGERTEIHKIKEGMGDLYLYMWETEDGNSIHHYIIIDLDIFRETVSFNKPYIPNPDGTKFMAWKQDELRHCILAGGKI
jgi:hypothetical protein